MLRICLAAVVAMSFAIMVSGNADAATVKKGSYAACMKKGEKQGISARARAKWCSEHGYN